MYKKAARQSVLQPTVVGARGLSLKIIWWNCGFSGLTKKRKTCREAPKPEKRKEKEAKIGRKIGQAQKVIDTLIGEADVLVLGEFDWLVDPKSIVEGYNLMHANDGVEYGIADLRKSTSDPEKNMDTIIIYNKNLLDLDRCGDCLDAQVPWKSANYRVYQMITVRCRNGAHFEFKMAVAHWRMRDGFGGREENRLKCRAADILAKRLSAEEECPYKIILGDFNVEPYEEPMQWIGASRSVEYVRKYKCLYNPFWRFLDGEHYTIRKRFSDDFKDEGAVFDSIMVNARFVDEGWALTPSIDSDLLGNYDFQNGDHCPVSLQISR